MREFYTPSLVSTPCYSIQNFQYPKFSFYTLDNIPRFPHEKEERRGRSLILSPESHKNSCRCWLLSDVRSTDNGSHSPERAQSRENFTKKKWKQSGVQRGVPHTRKFHWSSKQHTKHSLDTPRHDRKNQQLLSAAIYRSAVTQPTMHFLCEFHPRGKKKLFSQV